MVCSFLMVLYFRARVEKLFSKQLFVCTHLRRRVNIRTVPSHYSTPNLKNRAKSQKIPKILNFMQRVLPQQKKYTPKKRAPK